MNKPVSAFEIIYIQSCKILTLIGVRDVPRLNILFEFLIIQICVDVSILFFRSDTLLTRPRIFTAWHSGVKLRYVLIYRAKMTM